jgi:hypothetical protein
MPTPLFDFLFKVYPEQINGIAPLVPALWAGRPGQAGLRDVDHAFPETGEIDLRVVPIIEILKGDGFSTAAEKVLQNPKPVQDLVTLKAAPTFKLVRDYNGEYAPAIVGVLAGGRCVVVPALKPGSMRATLAEVDAGKKPVVNLEKCPEADNEATVFIGEAIRKSSISKAYYDRELEKCGVLVRGLFEVAGLVAAPGVDADGAAAMSSLHQWWYQSAIPREFALKVGEWVGEFGRLGTIWAAWTFSKAPFVEKAEAPKKKAPLNEKATVKIQKEWVSFMIWVRRQDPKAHTHNMGQDLLYEIVTAISHVCSHVYGTAVQYRFVLLGDRRAATVKDMPLHWSAEHGATKREIDRLSKKGEKEVPEFVHDVFVAPWAGEEKPVVRVVDCRDVYDKAVFTTPGLVEMQTALAGKAVQEPKDLETLCSEQKMKRGRGLSYWEQYAFFHVLCTMVNPRFIIGAESGNMDGVGYCGVPVVSVDVEDPVNGLDESILTDRIGQYTLLTPQWSLVNYGLGGDQALFRRHLYGTVLLYTRYGASLHAWKTEGKKPKKDLGKGPSDLASLLDALAGIISKSHDKENAEKLKKLLDETLEGRYVVVNATGDGNCLFRALSRARTPTEDHHAQYRQHAADYAAANFNLVHIQAAGHAVDTVEAYRLLMRVPAEGAEDEDRYGGHVEIEAFALRYSVTIEVYSDDNDVPVVANPGRGEVLRIYYVNRNHYKVLLPKPE